MAVLARTLLALLLLPLLLLAAILPGRRTRSVWGSTPLISNKYWSEALKEAGQDSITIMEGCYAINRKSDFDRYFADFAPQWLPSRLRTNFGAPLALLHVLRRARFLHISYDGFALGRTAVWRLEAPLLRLAGVAIIVMPYGADAYAYSRVIDPSLRYGLLASYPHLARREGRIAARLEYWNREADIVISGSMIDGAGRWDVTMNQIFAIDTGAWTPKPIHSPNDGTNGPVRIFHTPNHRGFKGTEFLVEAVRQLQSEGLLVELMLMEGVPNDEIRLRMKEADILAEQFIYTGYAMSGIEGMAAGLPVMANLDNETYTRLFRRFAFLDECPILSSTPESLKENLRTLVTDPGLREQLGRAGRAYVEKYHSYDTVRYLFGAVHDRLAGIREADLMSLFHPLKSDYNRARPPVQHPLVENRLPADRPPRR